MSVVDLAKFLRLLTDTYASQEYNAAAIRALSNRVVSPLKKIKRKVGYGHSSDDSQAEEENVPQNEMKRLCIAPTADADCPMS